MNNVSVNEREPYTIEGSPSSLMLCLGFMGIAGVFFVSSFLEGKPTDTIYEQSLLTASAIFVVIAFTSLTRRSRLNVGNGTIERRFLNLAIKKYPLNTFSKVDRVLKRIGETSHDYRVDVVLISRYATTPSFVFSSFYLSAPSDEEALAHAFPMKVARQLTEAMKLEA